MATLGSTLPTLLDFARREDNQGSVEATLIELLAQTNQILGDMVVVEGNLQTGHRTTVRTGLPSATWRMLNYGVQPSKSSTAQITDTAGMLEAYAEVDKALAELNGNSAAWRLSEDRAFFEAMNQAMAQTLFYGDLTTNPERFLGLAPRYAASSGSASAANVIKAGGASTDNTSIWLVCWGPNTVHGFYPKGSKAGLQRQDLGEQTLLDAAGGKFQGYRTHYKWDLGLSVRDWRYVVRICNIANSTLATAGDSTDTSANILKYMLMALNYLPAQGMGRPVFYMNNTVKMYLECKLINTKAGAANPWLTMKDLTDGSGYVTQFMGVPIHRCDQITNAESLVS
jgi:hypothetical protein